MRPLSATEALDRYYLEARARLLDLAGILDRIDRGGGLPQEPRLKLIRQALQILQAGEDGRAEQVQMLFSLAYEAGWQKPR